MKLTLQYKFERNQIVISNRALADSHYRRYKYICEEEGIEFLVRNDNKQLLEYDVQYTLVEKPNSPLWLENRTVSYNGCMEKDIIVDKDYDKVYTAEFDVKYPIGTEVLFTYRKENECDEILKGRIIGYSILLHRSTNDFYKIRYTIDWKSNDASGTCPCYEYDIALIKDSKKYKKI